MSLFDTLKSILERAVHIKPATLKHAPGIKPGQEEAAAAVINALASTAIDAALISAPHVAENALHIKPESLKGAPGVHDPAAAAAAINGIVAAQIKK